jgi:hypothetical protein
MARTDQVRYDDFCKAKTRRQCEAANWGDANIGCGNRAKLEVDEHGVDKKGGTPVCAVHQAQWAKGYNYGVNT